MFILITNDEERSPKELSLACRGQANVEAAFRWLEGPVRVSTDRPRIEREWPRVQARTEAGAAILCCAGTRRREGDRGAKVGV